MKYIYIFLCIYMMKYITVETIYANYVMCEYRIYTYIVRHISMQYFLQPIFLYYLHCTYTAEFPHDAKPLFTATLMYVICNLSEYIYIYCSTYIKYICACLLSSGVHNIIKHYRFQFSVTVFPHAPSINSNKFIYNNEGKNQAEQNFWRGDVLYTHPNKKTRKCDLTIVW